MTRPQRRSRRHRPGTGFWSEPLAHLMKDHPQFDTPNALAVKAGVGANTIGLILRDYTAPNPATLQVIAKVFGMKLSEFVQLAEQMAERRELAKQEEQQPQSVIPIAPQSDQQPPTVPMRTGGNH